MNDSNTKNTYKILLTTLTILFLTGFSAAAVNTDSLSVTSDTPAQPTDTITVNGTADNTDTDISFQLTDSDSDTATVTKTISNTDFSVDINLDSLSFSGGTDGSLTDGEVTIDAEQASSYSTSEDSTTFQVDGTSPSIDSASITNSPSSGSVYTQGETVEVTVNYDESIATVTGSPTLDLGSNVGDADYVSGSGTSSIVFEYTVQDGDDGSLTIGDISGGTIEDDAGNSADTTTSDNSISGEVDGNLPSDPSTTSITTTPINSGNQDSVSVDVEFGSQPESGTVTVQLSDDSSNTVTGQSTSDTSSTTTTVSGIDATDLNDGDITATAKIVDDAGNENSEGFTAKSNSVTKDTVVDTTEITATNPDSQNIQVEVTSSEELSDLTASDGSANSVSGIDFSENNQDGTYTYTATYDAGADGDYTVSLDSATDSNSNTDSSPSLSDQVTVDGITPSASWSNTGFVVTGTTDLTDDVSLTKDSTTTTTYEYSTDGGDNWNSISDGSSWSTTGLSDGEVSVRVTVEDEQSNSDTASTTVSVDNEAPTASSQSPQDETVTDNQKQITVDLSDTGTSVDTSSTTVTVSDSSETNPVDSVAIDNSEALTFNSETGTLTVDPAASTDGFTMADGQVDVTVNAVDSNSNSNEVSWSFTVDTESPAASLQSPTGLVNSISGDEITVGLSDTTSDVNADSIAVTLSDSDETAELEAAGTGDTAVSYDNGNTEVNIDTSSLDIADGVVTVEVDADDTVGNSLTDHSETFTLDTNPPEVKEEASISTSSENGIVNKDDSFTVSVNASDVTSEIQDGGVTVDLSDLNKGSSNELTQYDSTDVYNATFTLSSNGYEIDNFAPTVTITDTVSNDQTSTPEGVTVDSKLPTITTGNTDITLTTDSNSNSVANPGDTVEVTWDSSSSGDDVSDVGTVEVDFSNFGGSTVTATESEGTYTASYTVQEGSTDGSVAASVTVTDDAGNTGSADTGTQAIDNQVPGQPSSLTATPVVGGDVDLAWNAPEQDSGDGLEYTVQTNYTGTWEAINQDQPIGTTSETHTTSEDGSYTYRVKVADNSGNTAFSDTVTAVADSTDPSDISVDNAPIYEKASDSVDVEVSFTEVNPSQVTVKAGDQSEVSKDVSGDSATVTVGSENTPSSSGDYDITVTVTDEAGNSNQITSSQALTIKESVAFSNGWTAFSTPSVVEQVEFVGEGTILQYNGEEGWSSVSEEEFVAEPQEAYYFSDGIEEVHFDRADSIDSSVSRTLQPGWNLVGSYNNENSQAIQDVFSPVSHALNSVMYPSDNQNTLADGVSQDTILGFDGATGTTETNDAYWLRASETATLSTTPNPEEN